MRIADTILKNIEKNANKENIAWFRSIIQEEYDTWKISKEEYDMLQDKLKVVEERLKE